MKKDEPPFTFPKTLEEFEYAFDESKWKLFMFKASTIHALSSFHVEQKTTNTNPIKSNGQFAWQGFIDFLHNNGLKRDIL